MALVNKSVKRERERDRRQGEIGMRVSNIYVRTIRELYTAVDHIWQPFRIWLLSKTIFVKIRDRICGGIRNEIVTN